MSVSPAQNFSKPPPVPDVPTVICTSGFSSLNSSAAASANGATVDEPSIAILPLTSPPLGRLRGRGAAGRRALVVVVAAGGDAERQRARDGEHRRSPVLPHLHSILFSVGSTSV